MNITALAFFRHLSDEYFRAAGASMMEQLPLSVEGLDELLAMARLTCSFQDYGMSARSEGLSGVQMRDNVLHLFLAQPAEADRVVMQPGILSLVSGRTNASQRLRKVKLQMGPMRARIKPNKVRVKFDTSQLEMRLSEAMREQLTELLGSINISISGTAGGAPFQATVTAVPRPEPGGQLAVVMSDGAKILADLSRMPPQMMRQDPTGGPPRPVENLALQVSPPPQATVFSCPQDADYVKRAAQELGLGRVPTSRAEVDAAYAKRLAACEGLQGMSDSAYDRCKQALPELKERAATAREVLYAACNKHLY